MFAISDNLPPTVQQEQTTHWFYPPSSFKYDVCVHSAVAVNQQSLTCDSRVFHVQGRTGSDLSKGPSPGGRAEGL